MQIKLLTKITNYKEIIVQTSDHNKNKIKNWVKEKQGSEERSTGLESQ